MYSTSSSMSALISSRTMRTTSSRLSARDGIGHVGDPRAAPKLAIGEDLEPNLVLAFERLQDGDIFLLAERFAGESAAAEPVARRQKLGRSQQVTDMIRAIRAGHCLAS